MTTRPYELLARFAADGTVAGVSVRTITTVNGRDYESDPMPLSGVNDAAFAAFADQFSAAIVSERDEAVTALETQRETMQFEIDRLTALMPPPVPDAFLNADWPQFRVRILSDPAVQRVASENSTAWPLMVLYLAQLSSMPSRGLDIAQLWTFMESLTPVTAEEVTRINAIAAECGVPLQMNEDGSIG